VCVASLFMAMACALWAPARTCLRFLRGRVATRMAVNGGAKRSAEGAGVVTDRGDRSKAARGEEVGPLRRMDAAGIALAVDHLRACDPRLRDLLEREEDVDALHAKLLRPAQPPFTALCRIIVYQQLAGRAASTIWARFEALASGGVERGSGAWGDPPLSPQAVRALSEEQMRECGLSGRKASYISGVADAFLDGTLSAEGMDGMGDEELAATLTSVKGLGEWSVHMFMMFTLKRPDVLPVGDLAVRKGVERLYGRRGAAAPAGTPSPSKRSPSPHKRGSPSKRKSPSKDSLPSPAEMEALCQHWRPYRTVGACLMWHVADTQVDM